MTHIIPPDETELHIESEDCNCFPLFQLDEQSGEMVWFHFPFKHEHLLDKFIDV